MWYEIDIRSNWELYNGTNKTYEPARPAVWENSYAREYLREVYDYAFSDDEKQRILRTRKGDHLFLMTVEEIKMKVPPKYRASEIRYAGIKPEKNCWWRNTVGKVNNFGSNMRKQCHTV